MLMSGTPTSHLIALEPVDNLVVSFIDLLITSCGLRLINAPDKATHVAAAALDLMLISSHCPCSMSVHSGLQCCAETPGRCTIMGSDHYLCVASAFLVHRPAHIQSRRLLPLRNWSSTLLPAYGDLCTRAGRVCSCLQGSTHHCPARRLDVVDQLYDQ